MTKKAFLCGINYPDTPYPLKGCVNDVNLMAKVLTEKYGFTAPNRRMLTDKAATAAAIRERLEWLVADAQPGDVLYFHYSGHGSQMVNQSYDTEDFEPDNKDEIIVPYDNNWRDKVIRDDELKAVFDKVPYGVALTVVLDSCNSGTGLDQTEQYQPFGLGEARTITPITAPDNKSVNAIRYLDMPADIANRAIGLNIDVKPRSVQTRSINKTGLLIAASQSQQTSADAWIDGAFNGAATYYMAKSLADNDYSVTHKQLIIDMNNYMIKYGYSQRPELNGSSSLYETKFMEPIYETANLDAPTESAPIVPSVLEPVTTFQPQVVEKPKKKTKLMVAAAVLVAFAIFAAFSFI